ncbi:YALI0B12870p [Yarrowia lipolytica CLIB122]|uniref:DNA-(apurinic or apyrimidinic site) lyase n=2 Tax=Yarrowia lipolytica TaxID=4952 RepID=Q6CEU4_YARLI|nr:YALI0B12870p [Yarrowia lipolytica CLIB122]AOW01620.1 hypothetical protein YALI1_B17039g [Yarrowia lipolytica]KAB8281850.1 DNA glycosylase [Yarrowia lipolytica]KAE8169808.1 DNA glycosylase [Yarrowia lipolytica]KAJ8052430.1 DNA glycosylase [Yarrowia lipolytica]RMJ01169.1 DNA glycosylase [Yarrowia lipolytica]|eukprot:XP_500818.1 YALI0B12870p [Yarrowia lipolytica CLIB122]
MSVSEKTLQKLPWNRLGLAKTDANLEILLKCGQSFRWTKIEHPNNNYWIIGMEGRGIVLNQKDDDTMWAEVSDKGKPVKSRDTAAILNDYFNISTDTIKLYEDWSSRDDHFKNKSIKYLGIRVLRQDPWENLCSFICSSNNNVKRISQLVQKMTITFGDHVATLDDLKIHSFPSPDKLADTEPILRELGLGYRAKYISKTAEMLLTKPGGEQFLHELRDASFDEAKSSIMEFLGVGPKVADCVCLFSLDKHDTVPVDTHVWQIAQKDYGVARSAKTMTPKAYAQVQEFFREKWGPYAGWAHCVLFAAQLSDFKDPKWEEKMKAKKEALEGLEGVKLEESVKIQVKIEGNGVKLEEMVEELKTDVSEEFVEVDAPKSVEMKRKIGLEDLGSVRVHRTRSKKVKR